MFIICGVRALSLAYKLIISSVLVPFTLSNVRDVHTWYSVGGQHFNVVSHKGGNIIVKVIVLIAWDT